MIIQPKYRRFPAILLAVSLLICGVFYSASESVPARAESLEDLQEQQKELDQQIKDNKNKLNQTQKEIQNSKDKISQLKNQIKQTGDQILLYQQKIDIVNAAIDEQTKLIALQQEEIALNEEYFRGRVRNMYKTDFSSSTLATLLEADSFADFLNRMEILKRVSQSDNELIAELKEQKEEMNAAKAELEQNQVDLSQTKSEKEQQQKQLDALQKENEAYLTEQEKIERDYLARQKQLEKLDKELDAKIQKMLEELANNAAYGDGTYIWPLPGRTKLSSPYGYRILYGKQDYHPALDIPAPSGTNILAAGDGKVVTASMNSGSSYGNYIIIDHGNGHATLYAHCSRLDVSQGQMVTKGQTIGGVGTTGNSTGNHLHFEFRENGIKIDARKYIVPR